MSATRRLLAAALLALGLSLLGGTPAEAKVILPPLPHGAGGRHPRRQ